MDGWMDGLINEGMHKYTQESMDDDYKQKEKTDSEDRATRGDQGPKAKMDDDRGGRAQRLAPCLRQSGSDCQSNRGLAQPKTRSSEDRSVRGPERPRAGASECQSGRAHT